MKTPQLPMILSICVLLVVVVVFGSLAFQSGSSKAMGAEAEAITAVQPAIPSGVRFWIFTSDTYHQETIKMDLTTGTCWRLSGVLGERSWIPID